MSKIKSTLNKFPQIAYIVLISPILASWLYRAINPAYWSTTDPAAWFFLDSLAIFDGKSYTFIDHPGIPVQLAGSILLAMTLPFFENKDNFINYYIVHPETFLQIVNAFQLLLNIGTLIILYTIIEDYILENRKLAAIALSWMFFAIHPRSFSTIATWSHNSFNILGILWLLLLYKELQNDFQSNKKKQLLFGLAAGILAMIQLYLITWIFAGIVIIVLYNLWIKQAIQVAVKKSVFFMLGSIISITLTMALVYKEIPRMIRWFITLASYDGPYGTGDRSIYSFELLSTSLQFWLEDLHLLFAIFLISAIFLFLRIFYLTKSGRHTVSPVNFAFGVGLFFHFVLQFLLLSKMYYFTRYTLSLAAILPVFTMVAIIVSEKPIFTPLVARIKQAIYVLVIVALLFSISRHIEQHNKNHRFEMEIAVARSVVANTLAQNRNIQKNDVAFVYYEIVPTKCAGLLAANNAIKGFPEQISALCPNQHAINNIEDLTLIEWDILVILPIYQSNSILKYLDELGVRRIPGSWGIHRSEVFFVNENK